MPWTMPLKCFCNKTTPLTSKLCIIVNNLIKSLMIKRKYFLILILLEHAQLIQQSNTLQVFIRLEHLS